MLQIQLYGFNAELYHNMSEAEDKSQGIVGISVMVQVLILTSFICRVCSRGYCGFIVVIGWDYASVKLQLLMGPFPISQMRYEECIAAVHWY